MNTQALAALLVSIRDLSNSRCLAATDLSVCQDWAEVRDHAIAGLQLLGLA